MNVLDIIGNGFDISAGLQTDANVLIEEFCRIVDYGNAVPDPVKDLARNIRNKGLQYWSNFEVALGVYSASETVVSANLN